MKKGFLYMFFLLCLLFFGSTNIYAQSDILKGTVKDTGGETLIGAQIRWKDSKTISITDIDGNFSIPRIKGNKTLIISYIGYKQHEVNIADGQKSIEIIMEDDAQSLDELVVVGYGLQKKSSLTGSVETIKATSSSLRFFVNISP